MMMLLCGSLQIASTAIVFLMLVLSTCGTRECRLYMTDKMRVRSITFRSVNVGLCQTECFENVFIFASCHRSNDESKRIDGTDRSNVHPENHTRISSVACSGIYCQSNTRCVVGSRGDAVCVAGNTISSALEMRCATDSECPADSKFKCYHKTCKCKPGLSFNPISDSCIRHCKKYGVGFTIYKKLGISAHNNRRTEGKTAKECFEMCISEKTFNCITFEHKLKEGVCQLSTYGYLDVFFWQRLTTQEGWILAVRNCL